MPTMKHTGTLTLKHGQLVEVRDNGGSKVRGKRMGPTGKITSISTATFMTLQTRTPAGSCWVYYNGMWYKLC